MKKEQSANHKRSCGAMPLAIIASIIAPQEGSAIAKPSSKDVLL